MATADLHYLGLVDVGRKIQAKELSPVEATKAMLGRIEQLDGKLKSFAYVMANSALAEAAAAEKEVASGKIRGPLHGVPVAVKDLCWAKGAPAAHGMTIHRDFRPTEDATVVARLKGAGAIILGKLQQTEGAYADHHPKIDPPKNPWNADLWPGASSSGSGVATAAGLCFGSLGTDTGGSIRFPSAANGITGLKPTWGRVSRYGAFELAATLDHIGPMARSAVDCGAILGVIAGQDPKDTTSVPLPVPDYLAGLSGDLRGVTIGVDRRWTSEGADGDAAMVLAEGLRVAADLGAKIKEVTFPDPKAVIDDWFPLCGIEVAVAHEDTYPARKDEYGPAARGPARSRPAAVRHGLSEDRASPRGVSWRRPPSVRVGRSPRGAGAGIRGANPRQDGGPRRGRLPHLWIAPLYVSVRHDGKPDRDAARGLHRKWRSGRLPVRRPSLR
ncbi:amidase [Bradyrhizobium sp. F1.13.4]